MRKVIISLPLSGLLCLLALQVWPLNSQITHLTVEDGLSHNTINCILKDSRGYMWFGTSHGLNRYDGYEFTVYQHLPQDSTSISNSRIYSLGEDSQGHIWVGTGNGLNRYDPEQNVFKRYYIEDQSGERSLSFIRSLHIDKDQHIWTGTIGHGLYKFMTDEKHFIRIETVPDEILPEGMIHDVYSVIVDSRDRIWYAGASHGIWQYRPDTGQNVFFAFPVTATTTGYVAKKIVEDAFGNIWVATEGHGLFRLVEPEHVFIHYHSQHAEYRLSNNIVKDISQDRHGLYYIATDGGGVNVIDPVNKQISYINYDIRQASSLSSDGIYTVYIDNNDICWIGTFGTGINVIDPNTKQFKHFTHSGRDQNELNHPVIWGFSEDRQGNIWIGTDGGGVNVYDPDGGKFKHFRHDPGNPGSIGSNVVIDIYRDRRGRMWLGTFGGGLNEYDQANDRFIRHLADQSDPYSINSNDVWSMYEDRQGRFWVGTLEGLNLFDKDSGRFTEVFLDVPETDLVYSRKVSRVTSDHMGNIWFGGAWLGVLYHDTTDIRVFLHPQLRGYEIGDVFIDSRRYIWIATEGGGLARYDFVADDFIFYTVEDGLPSNTLYRILEDDHGFLWISTSFGLSRFDPESLSFRNYDQLDGLQGNLFSHNAALKSKTGMLYFGGINGFNAFYPDSIRDNQHVPPVVITGLFLMNERVYPVESHAMLRGQIDLTKDIVLNHRQSVITFEFAALNYTASSKNRYAYKLVGFDDDWYYAGQRRTATYTNLNRGRYTFMVKASNNDGVWNEQGVSLQITVLPPWWKTIWAYVLYIIIVAAIIAYLRHYSLGKQKLSRALFQNDVEKRKAEELNQLKLRFYTNISHEFRTPLTLIISPLERLIDTIPADSALSLQLKVIHKNTKRLSRLINQLMDFRKIETGNIGFNPARHDLVKFIREIKDAFQQVADDHAIQFNFSAREQEILTWFDREKMDVIIYNLLSNAFKFTPAKGVISVVVGFAESVVHDEQNGGFKRIRIYVKDTGIGIPQSKINKIFDRFYQINDAGRPSKSMEQQGTGIGLSLTKEFVMLHGGTVTVESLYGEGSTFIVDIPYMPEYTDSDSLKAISNLKNLHGPRDIKELLTSEVCDPDDAGASVSKLPVVLIVEDNEDMQHFIRDTLIPSFSVLMASDGHQGLEMALEEIPDLIISDVMMPGMDGFEMARQLKADEKTSHIPVVFLSAINTVESNLYGLKLGAEDYLEKPFNANVLLVKINNLINNRSKIQEKIRKELLLQPKQVLIESPEEKFIAKAISVIEMNISNPDFDVKMFYTEMGLSRSVLYRKLEAITGQSVNEFVRTIRLKRAADLLKQKKLSVSEVCYEVGFNDPQYFSRCFKKAFGMSPSAYTKKSVSRVVDNN